jgi:DNA-binding transcriptional ArsR family regulator
VSNPRCCATDPVVRKELGKALKLELKDFPSSERLERYAKITHAIAHPLRLALALILMKGDHCVCELLQLTSKKPNLLSHHLMIMRKSGLLSAYMAGGMKYYRVREENAELLRLISKSICMLDP